jgi:hypothetical protein
MTAKMILVHDMDEDDNRIVAFVITKTPAEHKSTLEDYMNKYQKRNVAIAVYDITERTIYDKDNKWKENKTSYKK